MKLRIFCVALAFIVWAGFAWAADGDVLFKNANSLDQIGDGKDKGIVLVGEDIKPITIVGPINGTCSGQVVVFSTAKLPAISAKIGTLATAAGDKLPDKAVTVQYATLKPSAGKNPISSYYDVLLDKPIADATTQPVWVTVTIPADAKAGLYTGNLTVTAGEKPTVVPVELTVCDWKTPNPKEGKSIVGLFPSFEATANMYNVPLWSDKHWALLEQSLKLLGRTGNDIVHIPAVPGTFASPKQSIITFNKVNDELVPDFTIFDKYIALYDKQVGAPKILVIDLWDPTMNPPANVPDGKPKFSYIVNNNGKYEMSNGPYYGEAGSEKIWQAVFDGIKASLKKQKWDNTIMIIGEANDSRPSAELAKFFDTISPGICWDIFTHGRGDPAMKEGQIYEIAGVRYLLYEQPDGKAGRNPTAVAIQGHTVIDSKLTLKASSTRHNWVQSDAAPFMYRALPDVGMDNRGALGVTRYGLDYWGGVMYTGWFNLWRNNANSMIAPGPTGPVSTVRFETFIEGIQELEARLVIEEAITAKKLDAALLKKATDLLIQRRTIRYAGKPSWPAGPNWQELTKQLFDVAGEIEKANAAAKGK